MIGRRKFIVLATTGFVVVAAAVGAVALPGERRRTGPPTLRYADEQCAYCGMIISDVRFAAAWRDAGGSEQHFDDIGCMVNASRHRDPGPNTDWWVHDYREESWLDAGSATYVVADAIKTPMNYRVAAFAHVDDTRAFVQQAGTEYAWSSLLQSLERKG
jgi:nitrous oxide reductase accessory protein NosL